jgi:hypothetical protein
VRILRLDACQTGDDNPLVLGVAAVLLPLRFAAGTTVSTM